MIKKLQLPKAILLLFSALFSTALLAFSPLPSPPCPYIKITPENALLDQETNIKVKQLPPHETLTIEATAFDENNELWLSKASFRADDTGLIDLSIQAPLEGSYAGIDPMGLLWSMQSSKGPSYSFALKKLALPVDIKVLRGKEVIASKTIIRWHQLPTVKRIPIRENGLVGVLFLPPSEKPLPVIITLNGSNGGIGENKSRLLASHGFAVFALGYFGADELPSKLKEIPLEYFETAFQWIKSKAYLDSAHIGLYGTSRGGELAILLGATFPESVQSIVAAVPSSVVYGSGGDNLNHAWLYHGMPVIPVFANRVISHSSDAGSFEHPFLYLPCYMEGMKDTKSFCDAAIPVEKIQASLMLISGGKDHSWPSHLYCSLIEKRLKQNKSKIYFKHLYYPKAGHGIAYPDLPQPSALLKHPVRNWCSLGGNRADNHYACKDSWEKLIAFFEKTLRPGSP